LVEVTHYKGISGHIQESSIAKSSQAIIEQEAEKKETYYHLSETKADYIARTYAGTSIVKIYKRNSLELLTVFQFKGTKNPDITNIVSTHLDALGFTTRKLPEGQSKLGSVTKLINVPKRPSFAVVPADDYLYQIFFASTVEQLMISSGLKVFIRPGFKIISTEEKATGVKADVSGADATGASKKVKEEYLELKKSPADYIVRTYAGRKQVRIYDRNTDEIKASFELNKPTVNENSVLFYDKLKEIGLPVRKLETPQTKKSA
jgi:hypothetical protein